MNIRNTNHSHHQPNGRWKSRSRNSTTFAILHYQKPNIISKTLKRNCKPKPHHLPIMSPVKYNVADGHRLYWDKGLGQITDVKEEV